MSIKLKKRPGRDDWYMLGTHLGVLVRESTKTADLDEAKIILAKKLKEIFDRHTLGPQATVTFGVAATGYLEAGKGGQDKRYIDKLLFDAARQPTEFSGMVLRDINQRTLDGLAKKLYPNVKASSLIRALYVPVSAVMHWGVKRGYCSAPVFDRPKVKGSRTDFIKPQDAEKLVAACPEHFRPLATFLIGTGCRLSEALYIDWSEVSLDGAYVIITGGADEDDDGYRTKTGAARTVPLSPRVLAALSTLRHREGAVFRQLNGEPYARDEALGRNGGGPRKTLARAARKAKLPYHVNPHMTRHTFATWHCMMGTHQFKLMLLGGWTTVAHCKRYSHMEGALSPADRPIIAEWLGGLDAHLVAAPRLRAVGE